MPVIVILGAIGFMLGTGGSALVAKTLGEEEKQKANEIFTMLVIFGIVSAAISFLRTLVFQVMTILIMPAIWGIEGVWYAIIVSETLAALTSVIFIVGYRKKYKY